MMAITNRGRKYNFNYLIGGLVFQKQQKKKQTNIKTFMCVVLHA